MNTKEIADWIRQVAELGIRCGNCVYHYGRDICVNPKNLVGNPREDRAYAPYHGPDFGCIHFETREGR